MPSLFFKERGLLLSDEKKASSTIIKDDYGADCERCPFCGTLIPLTATDCRGCGARRVAQKEGIDCFTAFLIFLGIMAVLFFLMVR